MSNVKGFDSDICYRFSSYFYSVLIGLLIISNFVLAIIDIVIASKWNTCHLENVDNFLYSFGSVYLAFIVLGLISTTKNSLIYNIAILAGFGSFGILIWGMIIFYDSHQGDCHHKYYQYGYYRTIIIMFFMIGILGSGLLFLLSAYIYEKMTKVPLTITLSPVFVKSLLQQNEKLTNSMDKKLNKPNENDSNTSIV